jgi:hypothetical protein
VSFDLQKSPTLLHDFHTASVSANHVDRRGVSSVLFCESLALLDLATFASASPFSIARQTQVGDRCAGLGGNTIANFPLPAQKASGNAGSTSNPSALSILGASAKYSRKMLVVSLLDKYVMDRS